MPTIDATVGGANSNSYATYAEVNAYFDSRIPITPAWVASGNEAYIITAARMLDALSQPFKVLMPAQGGVPAYWRVRRQWTGAPATTTQRLAWPRTGMYDMNGNAIASDVIPQDLKNAQAELAGSLLKGDTQLDNAVVVQGITSLRAGSVALSFKDNVFNQQISDMTYALMPASWLTDELIVSAMQAEFDVVSNGSETWP